MRSTTGESDLQVLPYGDAMYTAYAAFANRAWGDGCYQGSRSYLSWLYRVERTPKPRPEDFLIAVSQGAVVGCMHKMRLIWKHEGALVEVPALHNWIVDERFRTGVGIVLLTKAMRSDRHAYISSAAGDLGTVYRKLKCQEVQACWYRKVLRPVAGALRLSLHRLTKLEPKTNVRARVARMVRGSSFGPVELVSDPTAADLERMISSLAEAAGSRAHPHWSAESFRWRFFDPRGPKHLCLRLRGTATESDGFVLVAIGARRGLRTARLVEAQLGSPEHARVLLRSTLRLLKKVGAHVLLGYSAHPTVNARLQEAGWSPLADAQPSFFYHAARELPFAKLAFNGSAADFGFESISPE
jgi:hypothetical protein